MLTLGQTVLLDIEKPAAGGRMIARAGGQVVLVSGAIPGEQASVRITRVGKGVAYGQALAIEAVSPDRRVPVADPLCGGCLYAHIAYPRQLELKAQIIADAFARIGRVPWPSTIAVMPSPEDGYRMRARLHIRGGRIGFFREGTHDLCDARATRQLLPASCDVLDRCESSLRSLRSDGDVELELSENAAASERVVHLECRAAFDPHELGSLADIVGLTGLTIGRPPMSAGGTASVVFGSARVTDVMTIDQQAVTIGHHVLSFFQGNRFLLRDLVAHVIDPLGRGESVVDLYAGVGVFSVAAAVVKGAKVTAVEGDAVSADDLRRNAGGLEGTVTAVHQSVEAFTARRQPPPATLIVDPPRTGMSKESLQGAVGIKARQVIYVSCDVATLARDARRFIDAGYRLERIDGFDLFPNTPHVETVALFRRSE